MKLQFFVQDKPMHPAELGNYRAPNRLNRDSSFCQPFIKTLVGCAVGMASMAAITASAEQFEFSVKNLTLSESRSLPGGYGDYGSVTKRSSVEIKAPKATSACPLYGNLHRTQAGGKPLMLLDESKGTGKGYDRLIFDLNGNGDFTDDPVLKGLPSNTNSSTDDYEQSDFGPIELPADKAKGIWRPRFFVNIYLYNKRALKTSQDPEDMQIGQMRLHAANMLETTVDVNGVKQRFGLVDGNCNFALGDGVTTTKIMRRPNDPGRWYMVPGDYFLRDVDNSGKFERSQTVNESQIFSQYVYFGGKPYTAKLSADLKTVQFDAFTGPVGNLMVKGNVAELVLGLEGTTWEAITPDVVGGKSILPAGKYHLSSCVLSAKNSDGLLRTQTSEVADKMFTVEADKTADLEAGSPLVLAVLTEKQESSGEQPSAMGAARKLFGGSSAKSYDLRMNVEITGIGGEKYAGFTRSSGENIPPPRFQVLDTQGKELASGNFEYG
jgi:hypothetical protein